jgi:Zn-dependent metalloprotease
MAEDYQNAYWDGEFLNAPPVVQYLPDVTYHEVAWEFVQSRWNFEVRGQSGAILQSFLDILASLVKQTKLKQSAQDADWTIAPGGIAWVTGQLEEIRTNPTPLTSLKAPGTAYDNDITGKDPQVAHFRDFVKTRDDQGGAHINSGIPSKAFYETAIKITSEKAGRIWIESLSKLSPKARFVDLASVTRDTARLLYGAGSKEAQAVDTGWDAVGL